MSSFINYLQDSGELVEKSKVLGPEVEGLAQAIATALKAGGKILAAGNGGSAADAQHFIAELVVRFEKEREGLAGISLTTDTSILTACANDYSFEKVFSRQVQALGNKNDLFLGFSTSGNSPNILAAISAAKEKGLVTAALTGEGGGKISQIGVDHLIAVPHRRTALIQQIHQMIYHYICVALDRAF